MSAIIAVMLIQNNKKNRISRSCVAATTLDGSIFINYGLI